MTTEDSKDAEMTDESGESPITKRSILDKLLKLAASAKGTKGTRASNQEIPLSSIAQICVGEYPHPHSYMLMTELCNLGKKKTPELQFAVGSALSCIALGGASLAAVDEHHSASIVATESSAQCFEVVLCYIFDNWVSHALASGRQAAGIWLLSLVKYCPKHPALAKRLKPLQNVFSDLLSEGDEFTQASPLIDSCSLHLVARTWQARVLVLSMIWGMWKCKRSSLAFLLEP